ncbi:MAG: sodium:phosphate symporter [Bdellovibrionales bacterium RIFOXYD12_FULL_39_22]|nr:MAG: sodium:phosphate symporter [Bdellovibrionales bacterium RIFOXYB1_FULL_39_21]OFZ41771.1 MAG: sodium:phosphate symporter [Bdellovibrionales bacterium RIFOXYC12_FULL_39_17]OFZ46171.1 MAG: sodium:phosphate symporter [Bdellovibrionales bacterium RIFOXYC1_FULL_39_130]OFZ74998.1 MAG: sodium:phosphate symporter [Bdellovibrionales bacterium RIFOXYD1_FULL_39_84]OFZ92851.1 MAG: sodium:phosphate symporter [Bdellovibrionales bacterium RIFOXYD12_FULL_39_22]HLE12618.1 sodium:solute symporter family p
MNKTFESKIDFSNIMSVLDWSIFIAILATTYAAVIYGNRLKNKVDNNKSETIEQKNILEFLLMGRQLTLPLFVGTLVATWYGGILGVTKIAFESGIYNFITQGFFWYLTYVIFALFLVKKIRPYNALTLPDMVNKMFGPKASIVAAIFTFFNTLPVAYTISIGLVLQLFFPGTLLLMMSIAMAVAIIYSIWGGLRAIVFSDFVQFTVMVSSVILVALTSVFSFGGISFLQSKLPATHFSPTGGYGIGATLIWGFIALSTLVDPGFYQRVFAAKNDKTAKVGILISTLIWFVFDICTTLGGMYARATIPDAEPSFAYMIYTAQLLPNGLRGFFFAGIIATILSTLDSYLFIAGTTISVDLVPKKLQQKKFIFHHLGLMAVGILTVLLANSFEGDIKTAWKTLGSYFASCLLLPVMYGHIFPKKISDGQFVFASILGVIAVTYWRLTPKGGLWAEVDELYVGIVITTLGILLFPLLRDMTKQKK